MTVGKFWEIFQESAAFKKRSEETLLFYRVTATLARRSLFRSSSLNLLSRSVIAILKRSLASFFNYEGNLTATRI